MDNMLIHLVSALVFFYLCFFASLLVNIYFLFVKKKELQRHFVISRFLMSITTLINIIQFHQLDVNMLIILKNRPNIIFVCIIEWICLLSMLLFFIFSLIFFKKKFNICTKRTTKVKYKSLTKRILLFILINKRIFFYKFKCHQRSI